MSDGVYLPPRSGESDQEQRLRESLNAASKKFLRSLDAALELRTAPAEAQRTRHLARNELQGAVLRAMHAFSIKSQAE